MAAKLIAEHGDTSISCGAGAPVDYTDGTPPATGEGQYGKSSLYLDETNGDAYINRGTKAQPTWHKLALFSDIGP